MSIKSNIKDPATGLEANVVNGEEENALVVATRPLKTFDNKLGYFSNDVYGIDMNQNGAFGGTAVKIFDGTDSILWTATDIIGGGKTAFNNGEQNHTTGGALSIKNNNSPIGDVYEIAKGSDQTLIGYVSFTMWVYVDKDWKLGDAVDFYGYRGASQIGNKVDLSDYFDYLDYDTWHKITIPLGDMGLDGLIIDAVRIEAEAKEGKAPKYWLDDIQLEETGIPIVFTLKPTLGTWLHAKSLQVVLASSNDGTVAVEYPTMPYIPYDTLLGVSIASGIDYKRINNGIAISEATINKFIDFMGLSNARVTGKGSDGSNSWVSLNVQFNEVVTLKAEDDDKMTLTINDDLSGLLYFKVGVGAKVENRE